MSSDHQRESRRVRQIMSMRALAACTFLLAAGFATGLPAEPLGSDANRALSAGFDRVLVGTCVDQSGGPVRGHVEVFFELPPKPTSTDKALREGVQLVEAAVAKDGTYRVSVPAGARSANVRVATKSGAHFGPYIGLRGRDGSRATDEIAVEPITCGELIPVEVSIEDENGLGVDDGALYFFTNDQYPGDARLLSRGTRACRRVAVLNGSGVIKVDGVPRSGGFLRVDARDHMSVAKRLGAVPKRGALKISFVLESARSVLGVAPGEALYGAEFEGRGVLIAALQDSLAGNGPQKRASVYYDDQDFFGEFDAEAGMAFDRGGIVGYLPLLGAWKEGRSIREAPDLIAAADETTGEYTSWIKPEETRFEVTLSKVKTKERASLAKAKLTGNLRITTTGGTFGARVRATWNAKGSGSITVVPMHVYSAGGEARLRLVADAAVIFDELVDFRSGSVEVAANSVPYLSKVSIKVRRRSNSEPVAGAIVAAYTDSDEDHWGPVWRFETDEDGRASALFARGQDVRLVPDAGMFGEVEPIEFVAARGSMDIDIPVDMTSGSVEVRLGLVDDAPCRVTLMPALEDPPFTSYRVPFQVGRASVTGWLVETEGNEVAAAGIRPGGSFVFEGVPAGRYTLAVQTHLDLARSEVWADVRLACGSPLARVVEVVDGQTLVVEIAAPAAIEASLSLVVPKAIAAQLASPKAEDRAPVFSAWVALVFDDTVDVAKSWPETQLTLTKDRALTGTLHRDWAYVVRVSGVGAVDSLHVVRPGTKMNRILLDGAIVIELRGGGKGTCRVEITSRACAEDGRGIYTAALESVLELEPSRKRIRLEGLSPFATHTIRVTQGGATGELEVKALANDKKAKRDRKSRSLTRSVRLQLD